MAHSSAHLKASLLRARLVRAGVVALLVTSGLSLAPASAQAAASYTAVQSGPWDDPATWGGAVPTFPASTPPVRAVIPADISVTIDPDTEVIGMFNVHGAIENHGHLFVGGTVRIGDVLNARGAALWVLFGSLTAAESLTNRGRFVNNGGTVRLGETTNNYGLLRNDGEMSMGGYARFDNWNRLENVGHFDVRKAASSAGGLYNRAGAVIANADQYAYFEVGGYVANYTVNGASSDAAAVIENRGTIRVHSDDDDHFGALVNYGTGPTRIDNWGTIQVADSMSNGSGSGHVIRNRAGGLIHVTLARLGIYGGQLMNEAGATVHLDEVPLPGTLDNRALVDNFGLIHVGFKVENNGELRMRCGATMSGNAVTSNAPRDWCDSTPPTLDVPGSMVVEATGPDGATVVYSATATDDKDPTPTVVCQDPSGSTFALGAHTVSCSAHDYVGNRADEQFSVSVIDSTPPVITMLGDPQPVIVQHNPYSDAGATASDTVAGDLTPAMATRNAVNTATPGSYTVHYEVTDTSGNTATTVRTVTVVTAAAAVQHLMSEVDQLPVAQAVKDELTRPLARADQLLNDGRAGNDRSACRFLDLFLDTVERHRSKGELAAAQAATLTTRGQAIKVGLQC